MTSSPENQPLFKDVNYAIEQNIGRPRSVLEIGTDVGQSSQRARSKGAKTVGLELVKSSLGRARDLMDEAHFADIESKEAFDAVKGRKFDLVILEGTLDRVAKPDELLGRVAGHLEDGGPAIATWIALVGSILAIPAGLMLARRFRPMDDRGVIAALAAALFVLPVAVHGLREWQSPVGSRLPLRLLPERMRLF